MFSVCSFFLTTPKIYGMWIQTSWETNHGIKTIAFTCFWHWCWKNLLFFCFFLGGEGILGNSISNHPGHDTLTSQKFLHFCTICRYHWNMKTLKISAPNSKMFLRYCYLKIWAKYLIRTKIRHFEFTLSLITSGLRDLSKLKFGTGKFFGTKVQKSHLKYTKTSLTRKVGLICGTTIIQKKFFLQKLKTI